jgi:hypothetical protein
MPESKLTLGRVDVPASRSADDALDRGALVTRLTELLVEGDGAKRRASRLVVGLSGAWGSGKSSIMGQVAEKLASMSNVLVVQFNPWVFADQSNLIQAFFDEMRAQIGRSNNEKAKDLLTSLDNYREALSPLVELALPGGGVVEKLIPKAKSMSVLQQKRELEAKLKSFKGAVVILIDELDRVEETDVRALARTIKAIADFPNTSYLVAYDRARVEAALGRGREEDGSKYLEKIIQLNVPLRPLMDYEIKAMIENALVDRGYEADLGDVELATELFLILTSLLETPRDVKRVIETFAALQPMVAGEINAVDVLAYSALSAKAPALRDKIAADVDIPVSDPVRTSAMIKRTLSRGDPKVSEDFEIDEHSGLAELLTFLFPKYSRTSAEPRFGRLSERNNLMTMLFLGNPPFRVAAAEVVRFWSDPQSEALSRLQSAGRVGDFLGQLHLLWKDLPSAGDRNAVAAMVDHAKQQLTYLNKYGRDVVRKMEDAVLVLGQKQGQKERARSIVTSLIEADDFTLPPTILRHHMFAHGYIGEGRSDDPIIYDKEETRQLIVREVPRYRRFIKDGRWLSTPSESDTFFAVLQTDNWHKDLREVVEETLLDDDLAVAILASLMTPPGYGLERGVLEKFVSEVLVLGRLEEIKTVSDEYLDRCMVNLSKALRQPSGGDF